MKSKAKNITVSALIAALYTALTLFLAPISFGMIQIRISEALTVLPAVYPPAIIGLTLGCFLSNLIGFLSSLSPLGLFDCLFGTTATLIAALLTYYIGKKTSGKKLLVLAPLPPVLVNAVIIGLEVSIIFLRNFSLTSILLCSFYVLIGQILPCYLGGFFLIKNFNKLFSFL